MTKWQIGVMVALTLCGTVASAQQELWTAMCNDGQHFEFAQMRDGRGQLTFNTPRPEHHQLFNSFVAVDLVQSRYRNNRFICGTPRGNQTVISHPDGNIPRPVVHFCMSKDRGTIYLVRMDPVSRTRESGVFCSANVRVRIQ